MQADSNPGPTAAGDTMRWAVPGVPFERPTDAAAQGLSPMFEAVVSTVEDAMSRLADIAVAGFSADDGYALIAAQKRLRAAGERLDAVRYAMLPRIDRSDAWRLDEQIASGRFATWLARHDGISKVAANREVRIAALLAEELPATSQKSLAGEVSAEQLRLMCTVAATSEARLAALHSTVTNWQPPADTGADSIYTNSIPMESSVSDTNPNNASDTTATGSNSDGGMDGADPDPDAGSGLEDDSGSGDTAVSEVPSGGIQDAVSVITPPTGEQFLLDLAQRHSLYQFGRMARRFAHVSDPESDERGYKEAQEREYFQISPTLGGYQLNGFLTEEHGLMVKTAVNNLMDKSLNLSGDIAAARAARTDSQRCAQALADLAQLAMDTGMLGSGAIERRELVVHVSWTELQNVLTTKSAASPNLHSVVRPVETTTNPAADRASAAGPVETTHNPIAVPPPVVEPVEITINPVTRFTRMIAHHPPQAPAQNPSALDAAVFADRSADFATYTDGQGYLAPSQLKRLACDSAIRRIVFGPDSQVLDVGRSQRTVPAHVRAAVIARDKGCVYPGCDQPPQRCEVHHALNHWATGGETSAENSALLCWYHHAYTDQHNLKMRYDTISQSWIFTTDSGQPLSDKYEQNPVTKYELAS